MDIRETRVMWGGLFQMQYRRVRIPDTTFEVNISSSVSVTLRDPWKQGTFSGFGSTVIFDWCPIGEWELAEALCGEEQLHFVWEHPSVGGIKK